ncbi:MAG: hypothetical protein HYT46_01875 [Candidatus Vogelbacteria bacterium]|nr:hypothetical protein [Candidatus Vogelbacteria bacterium]
MNPARGKFMIMKHPHNSKEDKIIKAKDFSVIKAELAHQWIAFNFQDKKVLANGQTLEDVTKQLTLPQLSQTAIFRVLPAGMIYSPNQL